MTATRRRSTAEHRRTDHRRTGGAGAPSGAPALHATTTPGALGSLLVELARERDAPVAIDIRRGGQQLFHAALPGSTADNDAWIDRKRRVVERYGDSSYLVGSRFRAKGTTFEESSRLDPDTYAAHGGSFPIAVEGAGVDRHGRRSRACPRLEDHALVVEALEQFLAG